MRSCSAMTELTFVSVTLARARTNVYLLSFGGVRSHKLAHVEQEDDVSPTWWCRDFGEDLYDLARVAWWERYDLYDPEHASRVGSVRYIYSSRTIFHNGSYSICCGWRVEDL